MRHAFILIGLLVAGYCPCAVELAVAQQLKVAVISQSANNWPLFVAEEKGFFSREGLQVEVVVSGDSGRQIDGLANGTYDITHQASDHFMRAVENGKELFVFMTISRPIFDFVVQPEIRAIKDLAGKTIALDRPTTGYWLLFQKAFARNGLAPDAYKILPNLGGAEARYRAVKEGRAQGTFLNPPLSLDAIAQGLPRLTNLAEHFPDFPGSSGGARRSWAKQNEATLIRYLRGFGAAVDWLLDAKNRDEAQKIFSRKLKLDEKDAQSTYDSFVRVGLIPGGRLSMEGIKQILELMADSGQLKPPVSGPEKYADPSYQQKAAQGMGK
jgi:ABC-type nitrate/sulfonate/bicarbonate transport system substrate-binding protein